MLLYLFPSSSFLREEHEMFLLHVFLFVTTNIISITQATTITAVTSASPIEPTYYAVPRRPTRSFLLFDNNTPDGNNGTRHGVFAHFVLAPYDKYHTMSLIEQRSFHIMVRKQFSNTVYWHDENTIRQDDMSEMRLIDLHAYNNTIVWLRLSLLENKVNRTKTRNDDHFVVLPVNVVYESINNDGIIVLPKHTKLYKIDDEFLTKNTNHVTLWQPVTRNTESTDGHGTVVSVNEIKIKNFNNNNGNMNKNMNQNMNQNMNKNMNKTMDKNKNNHNIKLSDVNNFDDSNDVGTRFWIPHRLCIHNVRIQNNEPSVINVSAVTVNCSNGTIDFYRQAANSIIKSNYMIQTIRSSVGDIYTYVWENRTMTEWLRVTGNLRPISQFKIWIYRNTNLLGSIKINNCENCDTILPIQRLTTTPDKPNGRADEIWSIALVDGAHTLTANVWTTFRLADSVMFVNVPELGGSGDGSSGGETTTPMSRMNVDTYYLGGDDKSTNRQIYAAYRKQMRSTIERVLTVTLLGFRNFNNFVLVFGPNWQIFCHDTNNPSNVNTENLLDICTDDLIIPRLTETTEFGETGPNVSVLFDFDTAVYEIDRQPNSIVSRRILSPQRREMFQLTRLTLNRYLQAVQIDYDLPASMSVADNETDRKNNELPSSVTIETTTTKDASSLQYTPPEGLSWIQKIILSLMIFFGAFVIIILAIVFYIYRFGNGK